MKATITAVALALFAGLAGAQGAPLLLPPQASTQAQAARMDALSRQPDVKKVTRYTVDPNALNANVITVTLDKKTYTFVGQREKPSRDYETWVSDGKDGNVMSLTRAPQGVYGFIRIGESVSYHIEPGFVTLDGEGAPTSVLLPPAPASAPDFNINKTQGRPK